VKSGLEIIPVSRVGEVLQHALVRMPEAIEWAEPETAPKPDDAADEATTPLAH
jgi:ATP-dependent Lon protease